MKPACASTREALSRDQIGALSDSDRAELEAHLGGCRACSEEAQWTSKAFQAFLGHERALDEDAVRSAKIRRAMAGARADVAMPARRSMRWWIPATALAAVLVVVTIGRLRSAADDRPVVASGMLESVDGSGLRNGSRIGGEAELRVAGDDEVELSLHSGSQIWAAKGARFAVREKSSRVFVRGGQLRFKVKPTASGFFVDTPEGQVRVVGTRFAVTRLETDNTTQIAVEEGTVEVTRARDGQKTQLKAGAMLALAPAPPPPVAQVETAPMPEQTQPVAPTPAIIRAKIRTGELGTARALVKTARTNARKDAHALAELGMVEAELLLAEQEFRTAIRGYLALHAHYPKTPLAEEALYAAAQVAVKHPDAGFGQAKLLRRYLASYPRGRFASDAKLLLRTIGP